MTTNIKLVEELKEQGYVDIKDYEGKYMIHPEGKVFNLKSEKEIKVTKGQKYMRVKLDNGIKRRTVDMHRLLAEAFLPNPNNYPVINHKDENGFNNSLDNLEWCTYSYNATYGTAKQRRMEAILDKAEKELGHRYEVAQYTLEGELVAIHESATKISKTFGYDQGLICRVCNGQKKTAYGFTWAYAKTA